MNARMTTLVVALLLLIAANLLMVYVSPPGFRGSRSEGFSNYASAAYAGGAKDAYKPIGAFDGVRLTSNEVSNWRSAPSNEPLNGPAFELGPDSLFIFKNNQCKPECCGSSASCDGGCVCTTLDQRTFINSRGGNRTSDSGF
jgi:hypothetical protein